MEANDRQNAAEPIRIEPMLEMQIHIDVTMNELMRSVRRGRPLTLPNTRRLFARRWAAATWTPRDGHDAAYRVGMEMAWPQISAGYARVRGVEGPAQ